MSIQKIGEQTHIRYSHIGPWRKRHPTRHVSGLVSVERFVYHYADWDGAKWITYTPAGRLELTGVARWALIRVLRKPSPRMREAER